MGKTKRYEPRNGEFKKLRGSKKQRTKKLRANKANLQKEVKLTNRNPNTGLRNCCEPNEETIAVMKETDLGVGLHKFDSVEELLQDLNE